MVSGTHVVKPHTISEEERMSSPMLKSKILAANEDRRIEEFESYQQAVVQDTHASEFALEPITSQGFAWKQNSRAGPIDVLASPCKDSSKSK